MERNRESRCLTCKWGVIGKYSPKYGGCPIGCNRKDDNEWGKTCYESKNKNK